MVSSATNWKWTLVGGDCDNILPHPTFAMFKTNDGTTTPIGTEVDTLGTSGKEHGFVWSAGTTYFFYPGFSASGDYIVTGEFDVGGQHHSCSQKIQVRAPGIRAEACWDTEGQNVDLDIHMSRVDGFSSCAQKGWSDVCASEDCYYGSCYGSDNDNWGYASSPATACVGWGSQSNGGGCNNPRLDRDTNGLSGTCNPSATNPNTKSSGGIGSGGGFCGPENINVDAPANGSKYAVGVKYYRDPASPPSVTPSKTHVNVYCDGVRVMSTGFNPVTGIQFPVLTQAGADNGGDLWKVTVIKANIVNGALTCDVTPTHSQNARAATDGTSAFCVDTSTTEGANSVSWFTQSGQAPLNSDALCWH
jgi:hypothetical protein